MSEVRDRTYTGNEAVETEGVTFVNCRFDAAQLRYGGGEHPHFQDCTFGDVGWYFTDGALRTIQLLQAQNLEGKNQAFLDDLFRAGNYIGE